MSSLTLRERALARLQAQNALQNGDAVQHDTLAYELLIKQAEVALLQEDLHAAELERDTFEGWLRNSLNTITVTDFQTGKILFASDSFLEIVQRTREEIYDYSAADGYADPSQRMVILRQLQQYGKVDNMPLEVLRGDGTRLWMQVSLRTITYHGRNAILTTAANITETYKMQEQLVASQMRTAAILQHTHNGILLLEPHGNRQRYIEANPAICQMFGYTQEEFTQVDLAELMLSREQGEALWMQFMAQGRLSGEVQMRHRDGHLLWVEYRAVKDVLPNIHLFIFRDITEERAAAEAQRESEERFRILAEMTSDYAFAFDVMPDKTLRRVWITHHAFEQLTGFTPEESEARGGWAKLTHPEDLPLVANALKRLFMGENNLQTQYRIIRKDGSIRYLDSISRLVQDENGNMTRVYGAAKDMTDAYLTQQALAESEARFRLVADGAPVPIWMTDREGMCIFCNQAWLTFTGRPMAAELGEGWADRLHPQDLIETLTVFRGAFAMRQPYAVNFRMLHASGAYRWMINQASPRFNPDGTFAGYVGSCIDISDLIHAQHLLEDANSSLEQKVIERTQQLQEANARLQSEVEERRVMEQTLRQRETTLRALAENASDLICLHDANGTYTYVSPSARNLLGYLPAELEGQHPYDFFHPDDCDERHKHRQSIAFASSAYTSYRFRKKDGSYTWLETNSRPVLAANGEIDKLVTVSRDISAHKQHLAEIRAAQAFLQAIVDEHPAHIAVLDEQGVVLTLNQRWQMRTIVHSQPSVQVGTSFLALAASVDADALPYAQAVVNAIQQTLNGNPSVKTLDYPSRQPNGETLWYAARITGFESDGKQRVILTYTDITARKRNEQEILTALEHERELNQLKSRFVSMVSHEFRTPLAAIMTTVGILQRYPDRYSEAERQQRLGRIQSTINHLNKLLDDIIYLGKAQSSAIQLEQEPIDLVTFCTDLAQDIELAFNGVARIQMNITPQPKPLLVDRQILHKILSNLLSNALKYSDEEAPVRFDVHYDDGHLHITVEDYGIGIPLADQKRLFQTFHRGQNVGKTPGTGLGLNIVKQSVDLYGGHMRMVSEENKGTRFDVVLPVSMQVARAQD